MIMLRVENLCRKQGTFELKDISIEVHPGELYVILGPTGAGKTTLLDCIAGFRTVHSGRIFLYDKDITYLPPESREIGYIPQEPALFPHMSVFKNIEYGLKIRRLPQEDRRRKVLEISEILEIRDILEKFPHELSGGEKQRVSLARAIVVMPRAMLMDEPLAHLDLPLRRELRYDIRRIIKELNIPALYVTHDQSEAFSIADRLAIMDMGKIVEGGKPEAILDRPTRVFSAKFIGYENLFRVTVRSVIDNMSIVGVGDVEFRIPGRYHGELYIGFRPEDVIVFKEKPISSIQNIFRAEISDIICEGSIAKLILDIGVEIKGIITRRSLIDLKLRKGEHVYIGIKSTTIRIFSNQY